MSRYENRQWLWRHLLERKRRRQRRATYVMPSDGPGITTGITAAGRRRLAEAERPPASQARLRTIEKSDGTRELHVPPGTYGLSYGERAMRSDSTGGTFMVIADAKPKSRRR